MRTREWVGGWMDALNYYFLTVAKKHQNSVNVTSFHVDQMERGLSCLLTMELLIYVFVSSTNPCTRFSVRNSLK
jgi:hypothetical protein